MMRALIVLVLAALAPAFASDASAPNDGSGPSEPSNGYVFISLEDVAKISDLLTRMTQALREQNDEIQHLRGLLDRGGCA